MPPEQNEAKKVEPQIRTMRSDAQMYAKEKKLSSLQIAATSYARQSSTAPAVASSRSYKIPIIIAFAIILLGGVGFLLWSFLGSSPTPAPVAQEPPAPEPLVKSDGVNPISFSESNPGALLSEINSERAKTFRSNAILYLPLKITKQNGLIQYLGAKDLINILNIKTPDTFVGNITDDINLFIYSRDSARDLVIIFKAISFDRSFSSMLFWEHTMAHDLQNVLNLPDISGLSANFSDDVIQNNDTRTLKTDQGTFVVGYTIFNKKYIVVATSREALDAVLSRLIALPPR